MTAPRPLGMTGANDWTKELATKGLPELQQHYAMLGVPDLVMGKVLPHFGHNYNFVSREVMYQWFNKHLGLGLPEPVIEEDFERLTTEQLTVWDASHPKPAGGGDYERALLKTMTDDTDRQISALTPSDSASWARFREVVGGGVDVILGRSLPPRAALVYEAKGETPAAEFTQSLALLRNTPAGEEIPLVVLHPAKWNKRVIIWADAAGKAGLYGLDGLYAAGHRGAGQKIAVISTSNIRLDDVRNFRTFFGIAAKDPTVVSSGPDPGLGADQLEANIDVQWSGGLAPEADVTLVASKSTATQEGVDLSIQYAVQQNLAGILSLSYGTCERRLTPQEVTFFTNLWAQAAAQGITVLVASGDSGPAECESGNASSGSVASVNGLGSSPYVTSVGGTRLDDTGNPSAYWSDTNDPDTKRSLIAPPPEVVWNDSAAVPGGRNLWASGGGFSAIYPRPDWQSGPGISLDTGRGVPDTSVVASLRNPYYIALNSTTPGTGLVAVAGTSASAPVFAGIAALLGESAGGRVGNLNPALYALGRKQYGEGTASVFHDVTKGDNSVPGVAGYAAATGWDASTGLGSVDAKVLADAWPALAPPGSDADFFLVASRGTVRLTPGDSANVSLRLVPRGSVGPVATLGVSVLPAGFSASFTPRRDPAAGVVSVGVDATLTLTAPTNAPPEAFTLDVTATAGGISRTVRLAVGVSTDPAGALPEGVRLQVPAVVDAPGVGGAHFVSDLVAVSRSASDATLLVAYGAAPGAPGAGQPPVSVSLPAGGQLQVTDVIAFLRSSGVAIPADASPKTGTLELRFEGVTDPALVFAGSRTATPNPNTGVGGSFGTFTPAVLRGAATAGETSVYGLRESASFRSNLALVHSAGPWEPAQPIGLEVLLFDGDTGLAAGNPITLTLQPQEFHQIDRVLAGVPGLSNGYARIRKTSGNDLFIAYGVVNDGGAAGGGTSDGSLVAAGGSDGLLPVVLDVPGSPSYRTELTLANPSSATATVRLTFTPAGAAPGAATTTVPAGQQIQVPDAIAFLRSLGLALPAGRVIGTLRVEGVVALARTFSPNPDSSVGGTFGLAYPAYPAPARAAREAIVYGLRQDAAFRSNLAIADARTAGGPLDYVVELYDAAVASTSPAATFTRALSPGEWVQIDRILSHAALSVAWARVRPASGRSDFVAYGVLNDGSAPGVGTSDGSYVPMVVAE